MDIKGTHVLNAAMEKLVETHFFSEGYEVKRNNGFHVKTSEFFEFEGDLYDAKMTLSQGTSHNIIDMPDEWMRRILPSDNPEMKTVLLNTEASVYNQILMNLGAPMTTFAFDEDYHDHKSAAVIAEFRQPNKKDPGLYIITVPLKLAAIMGKSTVLIENSDNYAYHDLGTLDHRLKAKVELYR